MSTPNYSDFERGERAALLIVRSFILKHGLKEVDALCGVQQLHDIMMDANHSLTKNQRPANAPTAG